MTNINLRLCLCLSCAVGLLACHASKPVKAASEDSEPQSLAQRVFRAWGQEPGWQLTITPGQGMHLLADYGKREVHTPDPGATIKAGTKTYHAITEAHDLLVEIEPGGCQDVMSGERYAYRVMLTLDGEHYAGCGDYSSLGS